MPDFTLCAPCTCTTVPGGPDPAVIDGPVVVQGDLTDEQAAQGLLMAVRRHRRYDGPVTIHKLPTGPLATWITTAD